MTKFHWLKLMIDLSKRPVVLGKLNTIVKGKVLEQFVFDPYR